jgi:nitrogen fixation/metabolism regulation signal transduction histidine kinase
LLTKSVKTIVDQVDAMKRLVNEFRDYARLPAAELKPVDLNALVSDVLHLYANEGTAVPIQAQLDPACLLVVGDQQQLRQVLHNLLQNALDATESAGHLGAEHSVRVKTQWLEPTARVRLSVFDSGTGFPEAILKRAFEPYVTTKSKGTGLGLAVVKKIADEHRTRVDIVNRLLDGKVIGAQVSLSFATVMEESVYPGTAQGTL